jgi:hypothetical protein
MTTDVARQTGAVGHGRGHAIARCDPRCVADRAHRLRTTLELPLEMGRAERIDAHDYQLGGQVVGLADVA